MFNLRGRSFLTLLDFSKREIWFLLDLARDLKRAKYSGTERKLLEGLNICVLFQKTSTRTRSSFEVAAFDQGMGVSFIGPDTSHFGNKESVADSAKVLGRFFDGISFRGFSHQTCEKLSKNSGVPVWNALTDEYHPTQILADFLTVLESKNVRSFKGLKLTYFGDARNNVANSLMIGCTKIGMNFAIAAPKTLWPEIKLVEKCRGFAQENGSELVITESIDEAIKNADFVYTDVWVSMGEPLAVWKERIKLLLPYQVSANVMKKANKNAFFLHCLPAYHDLDTSLGKKIYDQFGLKELEVTDEVFQSEQSVVFEQAENRLHTIKAVMVATLRG